MTPISIFLTLVLYFSLTSCQTFRKSATWETVVNTRIDTRRAANPSHAYAQGLHDVLVARGVEHKIVNYRYHSRSRTHDQALADRSAVIYRDERFPKNTWWLKGENIEEPVSFLNADLDQQIRSYIHRDVQISWEEYSNWDGKTMTRTEWKPASTAALSSSHEVEADRNVLFRKLHGTGFDPKRATDREKMRAVESRANHKLQS